MRRIERRFYVHRETLEPAVGTLAAAGHDREGVAP